MKMPPRYLVLLGLCSVAYAQPAPPNTSIYPAASVRVVNKDDPVPVQIVPGAAGTRPVSVKVDDVTPVKVILSNVSPQTPLEVKVTSAPAVTMPAVTQQGILVIDPAVSNGGALSLTWFGPGDNPIEQNPPNGYNLGLEGIRSYLAGGGKFPPTNVSRMKMLTDNGWVIVQADFTGPQGSSLTLVVQKRN
jgi:hypothetical protein